MAAVPQLMVSLWPLAFSNFGVSSSKAACTPMVLKTLISAADAKVACTIKKTAIAATRPMVLLMASLPVLLRPLHA